MIKPAQGTLQHAAAETVADAPREILPVHGAHAEDPATGIAVPLAAPRKASVWPWLVVAAMAGAAWYWSPVWLPFFQREPAGAKDGGKNAPRVVPVRTAVVQQCDMPLFINGLGTVTAFKTVTLHSRVDGELVKVAFTEGQMVSEGDLLAQIDPRPFAAALKQAEGTLAKDQATLELAKLTLGRGQDLSKTKAIAKQQLDEEAAQVQTMEGTVQTDEGLVDNARLQLSYCEIKSPITGRIGLRLVDPGNIIHANDVMGMAVITQLQPISLVFPISQDDIPKVQKQMNAGETLSVEAYSRDFQTRLAEGKLAAIDNVVDPTTGTVKLKAIFENKDNMLFPNQFVNARLHYETRRNAMIVPSAAVQRGPIGSFVYVVDSEETAKLRTVVPGITEGGNTEIDSGLSAGEVVVTDGLDKLSSNAKGTKVTTRAPGKERDKDEASETAQRDASQEAKSSAADSAREGNKKDSQ